MPPISTQGLTKHFGTEIGAVDGIDLDTAEGRIFGFPGANGVVALRSRTA